MRTNCIICGAPFHPQAETYMEQFIFLDENNEPMTDDTLDTPICIYCGTINCLQRTVELK